MNTFWNDDEDDALQGISCAAQVMYLRALRRHMDYETGIVGLSRRINEACLRETIEHIPDAGSTIKRERPSRQFIRSRIDELIRAGLIENAQINGYTGFVFRLKLADTDKSVKNGNNRGTTDEQPRNNQQEQPYEKPTFEVPKFYAQQQLAVRFVSHEEPKEEALPIQSVIENGKEEQPLIRLSVYPSIRKDKDKDKDVLPEKIENSALSESDSTTLQSRAEAPQAATTPKKTRRSKSENTGETRESETSGRKVSAKSAIEPLWKPSQATLLALEGIGIPNAFCASLIEEFILYWSERAEKRAGWDATFRNWVKRGWGGHEGKSWRITNSAGGSNGRPYAGLHQGRDKYLETVEKQRRERELVDAEYRQRIGDWGADDKTHLN